MFYRVVQAMLCVCAAVGAVWLWSGTVTAEVDAVTTVYLDASAPDGGDGTEGRPFNDFLTAVHGLPRDAESILIVRDGVYDVPQQNAGVVDVESDVTIRGEGAATIRLLEGMTLTSIGDVQIENLIIEGYESATVIHHTSRSILTLRNNIIRGGTSMAIEAHCSIGTFDECGILYMYNNLLIGDNTKWGVFSRNGSIGQRFIVMHNNTIVGYEIGMYYYTEFVDKTSIHNNIFLNNEMALDSPYYRSGWDWGYNLFAGNGSINGDVPTDVVLNDTDIVIADALLDGNDDYRPLPNSPVVNTGNPDSSFNDPDGSRADIGAYGGPEADISTLQLTVTTDPIDPIGYQPYTMTIVATNYGTTDFTAVTLEAILGSEFISVTAPSPSGVISGDRVSWPATSLTGGDMVTYTLSILPSTSEGALVQTEIVAGWDNGGARSMTHVAIVNSQRVYAPVILR